MRTIHTRRSFINQGVASMAGLFISCNLPAQSKQMVITGEAFTKNGNLPAINSGIGGNNTVDLLERIDKDCLAYQPKLTILMIGTNDMNSVKHVPVDQYEKNLSKLSERIVKSKSKLLLMTILPAYEPYLLTRHPASFYNPEGVSGRRKQVNDVIRKIAKQHKVHLLDVEQRFLAVGKTGTGKDSLIQNEANSNKTDGIHPTPNGYRFMALAVYDYIMYHNLPKEGIVCFGDSITKGDGSVNGESYPGYLNKLLTAT
ncbi:MAG: GDSL-type esterase/lipase family protein [Niabella sp.]